MINIRPITESDAASFFEVLDTICRERRFLGAVEGPSLDRVQTFVANNVKNSHAQFIAEDGGRLVGWCDIVPGEEISGTAHVGTLGMGVLKDYRGQGVGRRLMETTIECARVRGLEKIELTVYSSNKNAITLYEKMGFQPEGCRRRGRMVDGIYDDIVLMGLMLVSFGE